VSYVILAFLEPLFRRDTLSFKTNGAPTSASLENWKPLVMPGLIIGFFLLIALLFLILAISSFFQKGGFFLVQKLAL